MKSKFLLLDSDNEARMVEGDVKDGIANVDGKAFFIDTSTPIILKGTMSAKPLYIIKWSEIKPSANFNPSFKADDVETTLVKGEKPKFAKQTKANKDVTPELFKKLIGLKILGNMIKSKKNLELGSATMLIVGMIVTVIILYVAYITGIIPAMPV